MSRVLLVDGTNLVMRYAHAMAAPFVHEPESDAAQVDVRHVTRACIRAVLECAEASNSMHVIVAFDSGDSWRKAIYPDYKANRTVSTRAWSMALSDACDANSIPLHTQMCNGYEADDVIATLERRIRESGRRSAVLSGDSDLLVLASDVCDVYQFGKKDEPRYVYRSPEWIGEKYGIAESRQLRTLKAIAGETGDNIPGLDGYGPVKARKLIARWGSAEALLESHALTNAQRSRLTLMLTLVRLADDAPIAAISPAACRIAASPTH